MTSILERYTTNKEMLTQDLQRLLQLSVLRERKETLELKIESMEMQKGHRNKFLRILTHQYFHNTQKRDFVVYFLKEHYNEESFENERKILEFTNNFSFKYDEWTFMTPPKGTPTQGMSKRIFPKLINTERYNDSNADSFYNNKILILQGIDPERNLKEIVSGKKDIYWLDITGASDPIVLLQDFLFYQKGITKEAIGEFNLKNFKEKFSSRMEYAQFEKVIYSDDGLSINLVELLDKYLNKNDTLIHRTYPEHNLINGLVDANIEFGPRAIPLGSLYGDYHVFKSMSEPEKSVSNLIDNIIEKRKNMVEEAILKGMIPADARNIQIDKNYLEMGFYLRSIYHNLGYFLNQNIDNTILLRECINYQIDILACKEFENIRRTANKAKNNF
ncbi:MAG: hypothetical protein QW041_02605 [Candidatus Pacearchaeota archaeon]